MARPEIWLWDLNDGYRRDLAIASHASVSWKLRTSSLFEEEGRPVPDRLLKSPLLRLDPLRQRLMVYSGKI